MFPLKYFSIEHRESKTKAIITANQNEGRSHREPTRT